MKIVHITLLAILGVMALMVPSWAAKVDADLGDNEVKMGEQAAAEVAKEYKFSDNAADLKRLRDMGAKIAEVANKTEVKSVYGSSKVTPFKYTFDIVEDKDINAFSVPGGHIYVYRGLLNFVQSDHELAGVVAHEVTHAAHHHMVYLLKKQASLNNQLAIALLATMLSGAKSADVNNVVMGVQLFQIAKLNGYGMQAERDADYGAVTYTRDAGYNPVGLLTFMERLAKRPELVDLGIYRSHPLDADRVAAAKNVLTSMKIPINRRLTTNAISAEVKTDSVNGANIAGVYLDGKLIYRPAATSTKTSQQKADEAAVRINNALDKGFQMYEMSVDPLIGGVVVRGEPLMVVSKADADLMNSTPADVSKSAAAAIRDVVWRQMVDTIH
ncbi:MAG: M48 family metalloprotease [Armatimonadota bacterium]